MVRVVPSTFDSDVLTNVHINKPSVDAQVERILARHPVTNRDNFNNWLLKAVSVIDLTTLSGDDTKSNVTRLCVKAANPLSPNLVKKLGLREGQVRTAAVCVYPNRVPDAYNVIKRMGLLNQIQIASVATGFPSGLYPLHSRLQEIRQVVQDGASEVDVVVDRSLALAGRWAALYEEVRRMREATGETHLKVILGVGELATYENVYKASLVSMLAGADFIKTSTGKEAVNATLPVGLVMCRAIRHYYQLTGVKVGLKPAGGIKSPRDAVNWLVLVHSELGPAWLCPALFRVGASSLLDLIEAHLDQNTDEPSRAVAENTAGQVLVAGRKEHQKPVQLVLPLQLKSSKAAGGQSEQNPGPETAKMLIIQQNGEQRLVTFPLPEESCTLQEVLEQVNVPFSRDTYIQCMQCNDSSEIDYFVTIGSTTRIEDMLKNHPMFIGETKSSPSVLPRPQASEISTSEKSQPTESGKLS